jgi:hypothetical protein
VWHTEGVHPKGAKSPDQGEYDCAH